jgi:hypothetical protein
MRAILRPILCVPAAALLGTLTIPSFARAQESHAAPPALGVKLGGESQFRYDMNYRRTDAAGAGGYESGFQLRRARLVITGSFLVPELTFRFRPAYDRASGNLQFDDAWVAYAFGGGAKVQMGQFKPNFLREEIVSGFNQLAAERSYIADYFTLDYTQGVELGYEKNGWHPSVAVHDGSYGANTDFNADRVDYAVSGRLEVRRGASGRFGSMSGWPGHGAAVMAAVAVDYEHGQRRGVARGTPNVVKATADVSVEANGWSLLAAVYAQRFNTAGDSLAGMPRRLDGAKQTGFVVQGGAFVVPERLEAFARYEALGFGGVYYRNSAGNAQTGSAAVGQPRLRVFTVGVSRYFRRDAAKLTVDLQRVFDPVPVDNTAGGILKTTLRRETVIRTQVQFRY